MLKPLLLLCCAATIVSAGESKNATPLPLETSKILELNADQKFNTTTLNTNAHDTNESNEGKHIVITTVSPNTTHSPPTTKPTTITTKPTTTTPTTTSTTTTPTTTTTTTTTASTSTTPAPTTPLPPPSTARWVVQQNKTLCIIVEVAAQLDYSYVDAKNVTIKKALDIPINGSVTGDCGKNEQNLTFSWKSQNNSTINDTFILHFVKNETEKHYSLHHLEISLASTEFPNDKSNKTVLVHVVPQFKTGLSNSYRCYKEQTLNLTQEGRNKTVGHLKVSNLQFQAFRGDNSTTFGIAQDCSFNTPDIVPIAVGCALAGLVVVVLIAYLVGRRRSQARGYLSM